MTLPPHRQKKPAKVSAMIRSPGHLAFVRSHECSVPRCRGAGAIQAAHVRRDSGGGIGLKPGDDQTISLCDTHHLQQHAIGERRFENLYGIDMKKLAAEFAAKSPALTRQRIKNRVAREGFGG